jgi:hypothetical protein
MPPHGVTYRTRGVHARYIPIKIQRSIAAVVFVLSLVAGGRAAWAADIEVFLSADVLQRFLLAATPFKVTYQMKSGEKAAELTFFNPKVILEPGRPGRIFVALDYRGGSELLKLPPFEGQTRPELKLVFLPDRGAFKLKLIDFKIKIGEKAILPLDRLIRPPLLPLVPKKPLDLKDQDQAVRVEITAAEIEVTTTGLRFKANYRFVRQPAPQAGTDPGGKDAGPEPAKRSVRAAGDCFRI